MLTTRSNRVDSAASTLKPEGFRSAVYQLRDVVLKRMVQVSIQQDPWPSGYSFYRELQGRQTLNKER